MTDSTPTQNQDFLAKQVSTHEEHLGQHRSLIDELKERAHGLETKLESALQSLRPEPLSNLIENFKQVFEKSGAAAELEARVKDELAALEQRALEKLEAFGGKFVPQEKWDELLTTLEGKLNGWMATNLAELEQKMVALVQRELATATPAAVKVDSAPAAESTAHLPASAQETPPTVSTPDAWPPFRSLAEHAAAGFYPDTYAFQKAEYEQKRDAALAAGKVAEPAPVEQQETSPVSAPSGAPPAPV